MELVINAVKQSKANNVTDDLEIIYLWKYSPTGTIGNTLTF